MALKHLHEVKGQTLVIVALSLFALIALVALAIDGGNLMAERRQMQNAADAGALAGARAICARDADPEEAAAAYAAQNGADLDLSQISISGQTAGVIARRGVDTYFAALIGFRTVEVGAEAEAMCGRAGGACGMWPLTFQKGRYDELTCGQHFLVWAGSITDTEEYKKDPCTEYNCNNVGGYDIVAIPIERRAWVDFSGAIPPGVIDNCNGSGCGADEAADRILGSCSSYLRLNSCIAGAVGNQGESNKLIKAVNDRRDLIVTFPIYDHMGCSMDSDNCNQDRFYITDFGCAQNKGAYRLCNIDKPSQCNGPYVIVFEIPCVGGADASRLLLGLWRNYRRGT